jgi:FkbM family methyltransferase
MRIRGLFHQRDLRRMTNPFEVQRHLCDGTGPLTIFDVGAYVGDVARTYRRLFPQATIFCFEPFPGSFDKLKASCRCPSIRLHQVALSNREGKATFYVNADASCNSTLPPDAEGERYRNSAFHSVGETEVSTTTLDVFCDESHVDAVNILKMDVEGAEVLVLEGATRRLKSGRIDLVYSEVMFTPHYVGGRIFHEISAFLHGYGYTLFNLYQLRTARNGQLRWGNAIFLSPQLRARVEQR